jgi:hypothetical protein
MGLAHIDCAPGIAAEPAAEMEQQEFLFASLRRLPRLTH